MPNAILSMASDLAVNVDGIGSEIPDAADFDFLIENIIGTNWIQENYNIDMAINFNALRSLCFSLLRRGVSYVNKCFNAPSSSGC